MANIFSKIPSISLLLDKLRSETKRIDIQYIKQLLESILNDIKSQPNKFKLESCSREEITEVIIKKVRRQIEELLAPSLKRVINATGVILHTGLGRAPFGVSQLRGIEFLSTYTNLEIDLTTGRRGERLDHVTRLLCMISGAQDGIVVNNNAAAVLVTLNSLARRKEVIVSRGELVEIGGSFRMPEVMKNSGAKMVEIGTTNKTHFHDYQDALTDRTAAIMLVHPSNYRIVGFTEKPEFRNIIKLAHDNSTPIIYDLGSGALIDYQKFGFEYEPVVADMVSAGVDVITFSGDKLLGGPQAGIIVGKKELLKKIRKNHLLRALRCDKLTLALLASNLQNYLQIDSLENSNATIGLFARKVDVMRELGEKINHLIHPALRTYIKIVDAEGRAGSGAYPVYPIKSLALQINTDKMSAEQMARKMRLQEIPIFGYIENDTYYLNLLTIFDKDIDTIAQALNQTL
jgi:L-seryl-tRNA(Ser) seleniumtransferase